MNNHYHLQPLSIIFMGITVGTLISTLVKHHLNNLRIYACTYTHITHFRNDKRSMRYTCPVHSKMYTSVIFVISKFKCPTFGSDAMLKL